MNKDEINERLNRDSGLSDEVLKLICDKYNAQYVCDTEHHGQAAYVFYGDKPHEVSKSRYFAIIFQYDPFPSVERKPYIINGAFVLEQTFGTAVADDGELLFSRGRHDYRQSKDGSAMVDGGRDYLRTNGCKTIRLRVRRGKFEEVPV